MERLIHANDNAREAKVTLWIFEGSSLYVLIVSVALALAGFRYAYDRLGLGTWASAGVGAAPLVLASVYVLTLKLGKPKSYDIDAAVDGRQGDIKARCVSVRAQWRRRPVCTSGRRGAHPLSRHAPTRSSTRLSERD
jgi:hypothetical protein